MTTREAAHHYRVRYGWLPVPIPFRSKGPVRKGCQHLRLAEADWKILVVGETQVAHKLSGTTGVTSPYIVYYSTRNRLICLFRHGRPFRSARNALRVARSFYHQMPRHGLTNWACHRAFARGIVDFLLGVRGRGHPPADLRG